MRAEATAWNRTRLAEIDQELRRAIGDERAALVEERRLLLKDINRNPVLAHAKKPPAQLDREIAEALGARPPAASAVVEKKLTAKRAKDFRDSGNYEVRDETGALVALLYRDPESREWYEDQLPGSKQQHFTELWRGFSQADALATIARRRGG